MKNMASSSKQVKFLIAGFIVTCLLGKGWGNQVTLEGLEGTFMSPNYPQNYGNNEDEVWIIIVPKGCKIQGTFNDFSLERGFDFVQVRDGPNAASNLIATLTGYLDPAPVIMSTGSSMYIRFTSDFYATRRGFKASFAAVACPDECADGTHNCHDNATCTDTKVGFKCTCKSGFIGEGFNCTDVDECAAGTDNCHDDAVCTNTVGGYNCTCKPGYTGNGDSCTEINECADGTDDCHDDAVCTNTIGGFSCTCKPGYTGNGNSCTDINECADGTDNCHDDAECTNTVGGFNCTCKPGYTGNGVNCTDINECAAGTDNCHDDAECTNTMGGFNCTCETGFTGDGVDCIGESVDGNWTQWRPWSECSECCGGGNQTRDRTCTNPPPSNGGANCQGPSSESRECFTHPCEVNCIGNTNTLFPHEKDCSRFYKCESNSRTCRTCEVYDGTQLYYDTRIKLCNLPCAVSCTNGVRP